MRECGAQNNIIVIVRFDMYWCLYVQMFVFVVRVSLCLLSWQGPAAHSSYISGFRHVILHKSPWKSICYASHMGVYLLYTNVSSGFIFQNLAVVNGDVSHCYSFTPLPYCVTSLPQLIIMYCEVKCCENELKNISLAVR